MTSNNISLTLHWDEQKRKDQYPLIISNNYGLEIVSFSHFSIWETDYKPVIHKYKNELMDYSNNYISFHGPIHDIVPHSEVTTIFQFAKQRIETSIQIALELNAKRIVFHTGINTIITDPSFIRNTIDKQGNFWNEICTKYPNIDIVLENMWEKNAAYLTGICKYADKPNLGICLDIAHANVYSHESCITWIKESEPFLKHIHLNDNNGKWDEHLALGNGNININNWMSNLSHVPNLHYVIELIDMEAIKQSLLSLKPFLPNS
jgi:sugar phosphate isomerase/epimerase